MSWVSAVFIYLIIWWVVLFAVLPWGVRPQEDVVPGSERGAPQQPRMAMKLVATTVVSAIVFGIGYALIATGIVDWFAIVDPR